MRNKSFYSLICLAVALVFLFVSCSLDHNEEMATIQFALNEQVTRTIGPDQATMVATQYRFKFENGPKDLEKTIAANATGSYRLDGIVPGAYKVTVDALNANGTVLATSSKNYRFLPGLNNYSVTLDALAGTGTLKVTFTWDKALFTDNEGKPLTPEVELVLKNQAGDTVTLGEEDLENDAANGSVILQKTQVPAGSYLLTFVLKNGEEIVTGAVDVARITNGVTTEGTIHLNLNKTIEVEGFAVTDNTSAPIVGHITPSKTFQVGDKGTSVSFTLEFDSLPSGVSAEDVTVTWYNEEFKTVNNSVTAEFIPYQGTSRITAVYKCSKIGSMGSASIDYYYPGI